MQTSNSLQTRPDWQAARSWLPQPRRISNRVDPANQLLGMSSSAAVDLGAPSLVASCAHAQAWENRRVKLREGPRVSVRFDPLGTTGSGGGDIAHTAISSALRPPRCRVGPAAPPPELVDPATPGLAGSAPSAGRRRRRPRVRSHRADDAGAGLGIHGLGSLRPCVLVARCPSTTSRGEPRCARTPRKCLPR